MKAAFLLLGLCLATVYSSIISLKPERKLADADHLKHQKQILDLYWGLGHTENFHNEYSDFDLNANAGNFHRPEVVQEFLAEYREGFLPVDGIFSLQCHHTLKDTILLFDLFYFAKDFTTFYKVASWARSRINPLQFASAYTLALLHREDCQYYSIPPLYEVFPNYFVPADTLHQLHDARFLGVKERKFTFNNTGYEWNYHDRMFGGPLDRDAVGQLDYKISYLREDVGANNWYTLSYLRFPVWMNPEKYRGTHWYRRGETLYYRHQQLYARNLLERLANGLPYIQRLIWNEPIKVGYNPRLVHINGLPFFTRPDNLIPEEFDRVQVIRSQILENRISDVIDAQAVWEISNKTLIPLQNEDGIDLLGKIIYGVVDRPNKSFFGRYFWQALSTLGSLVHTSSDRQYVGGATFNPLTVLRDPAYYQLLNRVLSLFQIHKKHLPRYTRVQLNFEGVSIKDFEVDKLLTYFDNFEFDVSNAIPVKDPAEYEQFRYYARQYRLNHKPYNYKITVNSDESKEAIVRVYIGPKYDSEEHEYTLEQRRLAFVEIDHFPVKLAAGENIFERNSKESTIFTSDQEGLRSLYERVNNALNNKEPYYYTERHTCGVPNRYQLPKGWKNGQPFTVAIVITPYEQQYKGDEKQFYGPCGGPRYYDNKPLGFPFDRPLEQNGFHVPNILLKDVLIYHKEESDVNRNQ